MDGVAVTLEGTVIHKSGLITGGRSSHDTGKKWEEKDIQGTHSLARRSVVCLADVGLNRLVAFER